MKQQPSSSVYHKKRTRPKAGSLHRPEMRDSKPETGGLPQQHPFLQNSDQFQDSHFSCIAAAGSRFVNTGITAVAVSVFGGDYIKQLLGGIFIHEECQNLTTGAQITFFWPG